MLRGRSPLELLVGLIIFLVLVWAVIKCVELLAAA